MLRILLSGQDTSILSSSWCRLESPMFPRYLWT